MRVKDPPPAYSQSDQREFRNAVREEDAKSLKKGQVIEDPILIFTAPNGNRYRLGVSNTGTTTWTAYP